MQLKLGNIERLCAIALSLVQGFPTGVSRASVGGATVIFKP
jgi:hypothetical protein